MLNSAFDPRPLSLALLASVALALAPAQAREDEDGGQAEWAQDYASPSAMQVRRVTTPVLSAQTTAATEQMVQRYQQIVARGGWRAISGAERARVGSQGAAVSAIRQRLIATGDLDASAGEDGIYDSYVAAGVKRFQARHGLNQTGQMSPATQAAMNVPADIRLKQLETNVQRLRSYSGNLGQRYVITNIPAALVQTVEGGSVVTQHAAGVGKIDRQSPIMNTKAIEVNFNPTWTVPASIVKKDLIPKMQADPEYLTRNKIHIYGPGGGEVPVTSVNWHSNDGTRFTYRQESDPDINSMGIVRININNPHGVFMHDTNSRGVFGDDFRFISSGCVRVQNVREYITWLLKNTPGWDRARVAQASESRQRIDARIADPVPVYWVYITAWATPDGVAVPSTIEAPPPSTSPVANAVPSRRPAPSAYDQFDPGEE